MKKVLLATALVFALAACSGQSTSATKTSEGGASPAVGLYAARLKFCKDLVGSAGIVYRPVETMTGPADAPAVESWVVQIQSDAKMLEAAGNSAAATQAQAYADAVSKYADDLKLPVPSNPEAAKKWQQRAVVRRTQLLKAVTDEYRPFYGFCQHQIVPNR